MKLPLLIALYIAFPQVALAFNVTEASSNAFPPRIVHLLAELPPEERSFHESLLRNPTVVHVDGMELIIAGDHSADPTDTVVTTLRRTPLVVRGLGRVAPIAKDG